MALFLFRFYPVLLPLLVYLLWRYIIRSRARKQGEPIPKFWDAKIFWVLMASLIMGILCFVVLGISVIETSGTRGNYQPPNIGKVNP